MAKFSETFSYKSIPKIESVVGSYPVSNKSIYFGIEIELEEVNFKVDAIPETWKVTEDGSLKVNGFEFVSCPLKQQFLETELRRLFQGIDAKPTSRCSVHVHMNARDFTEEELAKFMLIYLVFEKGLFNYSGERWDNNYCMPLFETTEQTSKALKDCLSNFIPGGYWSKYFALNLCPIWGQDGSQKQGTIEFRHMKGNMDVEYILDWVNLISRIKIATKKMELDELLSHIRTMNTTSGYYWLAKEVFGKWSTLITTQPTFKQDVESCISRVKYFLL